MAYGYIPTRYQYETSPRKLKPEYEKPKNPYSKKKSSTLKQEQKQEKKKKKLKPHVKAVMYILLGFSILFAISYRNSLITANFQKKENLKQELSTIQKENAQLQINIQNNLNLRNVEKSAGNMLGMKKLDDSQKVYVNLPKRDYVEPASEQVIVTQEQGWFQNILDKILDLLK